MVNPSFSKFAFAAVLALSTVAQAQVDRELEARWNAWYKRQVSMDCVPAPYDEAAIDAVRRAHLGERSQRVYGPPDPYKRRAATLENLKTRKNPHGEGVIVTAWKDAQRGGSADYSRRRSAWLVLGRVVYPINVTASGDVGLLFDGLPEAVQKRSGLTHTFVRGQTMTDQLGLEEFTSERRFVGGNPFPTCR